MRLIQIFIFTLLTACFTSPQASSDNELIDPDAIQKISIQYSNNHAVPHNKSTMTNTDVENAAVKQYVTAGSDHFHFFQPTPKQMLDLRNEITINIVSASTNNHNHVITISYDREKN